MNFQKIRHTDYPIYFGSSREALHTWLATQPYSKIVALLDANVHKHWASSPEYPLLEFDFPTFLLRGGERSKNLQTCQRLWSWMVGQELDRHALVLLIGGGVTGDLGGFCTSTFKRGLPFVHIPTTLLAQVDAAIGGKTGLNFRGLKNMIGTFQMPKAIFIDPGFLKTLPKREVRSGFAEIIKHALIRDATQWAKLSGIQHLESVDWAPVIRQSVEVKLDIVEADPHESGIRKVLNFGHTIGHAIESWFFENSKPLRHGEAIAAGMICEAYISSRLAGLPAAELIDIQSFIIRIFGKIEISADQTGTLLNRIRQDKKNRDGQVLMPLLPSIGDCRIDYPCPEFLIAESVTNYLRLPG